MLSLTSDHLIWQKNIIYNFTVIYISLSRFGCHCCSLSHGFLTCSTHISKRKIWHSSEHQCTTSQLDAHYCNCITQALLFGLFEAFKFYTIVILSTYTRHSHTHLCLGQLVSELYICYLNQYLLSRFNIFSITVICIIYIYIYIFFNIIYNVSSVSWFRGSPCPCRILVFPCPPCPVSSCQVT